MEERGSWAFDAEGTFQYSSGESRGVVVGILSSYSAQITTGTLELQLRSSTHGFRPGVPGV